MRTFEKCIISIGIGDPRAGFLEAAKSLWYLYIFARVQGSKCRSTVCSEGEEAGEFPSLWGLEGWRSTMELAVMMGMMGRVSVVKRFEYSSSGKRLKRRVDQGYYGEEVFV